MTKKPTATIEPVVDPANLAPDKEVEGQCSLASPTTKPNLSKPSIRDAVAQGKALLAEGKSKADAARAIFSAIGSEPKEVTVAAFVEGAGLTEKGSLTYWYNCRRKASKAIKA